MKIDIRVAENMYSYIQATIKTNNSTVSLKYMPRMAALLDHSGLKSVLETLNKV